LGGAQRALPQREEPRCGGMLLDIKNLFGYNWYSRRRFLKSIAEIPWDIVVENCGASFDSIRNIFVHSLQAEESWIRELSGKSTEGNYDTTFTKFTDVKTIQEYADRVEAETNEYLETLTDEKLQSVFEFKGWDGKMHRSKIEDILMHVIEEEIHHRGELLCIYWQHNIQPPYTTYTAYTGQSKPSG
jgi:uncharacterized damage-inducible protein DinB